VLAESLFQHADHYFRIYSAFNEETEARRIAALQDNVAHSDSPSRADDDGDGNGNGNGNGNGGGDAHNGGDHQQHDLTDDDQSAPRRTRSERRQEAEAAEQGAPQERPARPPRRRRAASSGTPESDQADADNDAALRAMLGASEAGLPKAVSDEAGRDSEPAAEEAKPVRRRGRPRKVTPPEEQPLPLAGED